MNKLVAVAQLAVCFVLLLYINSSGQNRPAELVGIWIHEYTECTDFKYMHNTCEDRTKVLELFKDGMVIWYDAAGSWDVLDGRLRVKAGSESSFASNYKISGYELTLTDNAGKKTVFIRKEILEESKAKQKAKQEEERAKQEAKQKTFNDYNNALENADAAFGKQDYDRAISFASEAIKIFPDSAKAYNNRGAAYTEKKDYDKAIADFTEAIKLDPEDADYYNNRGVAYCGREDYNRAIADYTKAIQMNPRSYYYYFRGWAYHEKKDYDKAISDYTKTLQLDPNMEESYLERGKAYNAKGDYKKAAGDFITLLQISKDDEKIKEAKAGLERVLKAAPNAAIIDSRDKKIYKTVTVANKTWMAENLNYNITGSVCYNDKAANCEKYGRLYTWDAAMKACPAGTHLPSDEEWKSFESYFNGGKKYSEYSADDIAQNIKSDGRFSIQQGGRRQYNGFHFLGHAVDWWSSTGGNQKNNAKDAWVRSIINYGTGDGILIPSWGVAKEEKNSMGSVRCVKD